jgi:hypothetical protein
VDGTDHFSHTEQGQHDRRHVAWRNRNAHDRRLGPIVNKANLARQGTGKVSISTDRLSR